MKKFIQKLAIVPALMFAGIPVFLLTRGMGNMITVEEEAPLVVEEQKYSQYEVSYCSGEQKEIEFIPEHITIPNANIDLPVVTVPLTNGTWNVYANVANYAAETSKINLNSGNVGIYAHNRKTGFAGIQTLVEGSAIEVYGGNYVATYRVTKREITTPNAVEVFYPTDEPTLTLVTCDGAFSEKRYILQGTLISVKERCNETTN